MERNIFRHDGLEQQQQEAVAPPCEAAGGAAAGGSSSNTQSSTTASSSWETGVMPTLPPFPPPPPVVPQSAAESLRLQKRPLQKAKRVQRRANAALRRIVIEAFLDAAARVMEEELRKRRLRSLVCTGGYWVVLGGTGG